MSQTSFCLCPSASGGLHPVCSARNDVCHSLRSGFLRFFLFYGLSHALVLQLAGSWCPGLRANSYTSLPSPGKGKRGFVSSQMFTMANKAQQNGEF